MNEVKFSGEVHPVAALFPMLADDELDDLEADVKAHGLLQPITLDPDGRLLDGRNRLLICERLGIEPTFALYDGPDPDAYCLSVNVARRHLTKGQIAMVAARAGSLETKDRRDGTKARLAERNGVSAARISQAVVVLEFAPTLVDLVIAGGKPLDDAYKEARKLKEEGESESAQMERLRQRYSDLADLVKEERLSLVGALAEAERRDADKRKRVKANTSAVVEAVRWASLLDNPKGREMVVELFDPDQARQMFEVDQAAVKRAAANLTALAKEWPLI